MLTGPKWPFVCRRYFTFDNSYDVTVGRPSPGQITAYSRWTDVVRGPRCPRFTAVSCAELTSFLSAAVL